MSPGNSKVKTRMPRRGSAQLLAETVPNAARLRAAARDDAVGETAAALPWLVCEDVEPSAAPAPSE